VRFIADHGAMVDLEDKQLSKERRCAQADAKPPRNHGRHALAQLLKSRMMLGIFVGQYCVTTLTYFFLTWFPIYPTTSSIV
jgi:MFS transporter, ACS family, glucarate transporter